MNLGLEVVRGFLFFVGAIIANFLMKSLVGIGLCG